MFDLKREVKRSSTFTFTCDLSFIFSTLFAKVNLTCDLRINYATVEIHPLAASMYRVVHSTRVRRNEKGLLNF